MYFYILVALIIWLVIQMNRLVEALNKKGDGIANKVIGKKSGDPEPQIATRKVKIKSLYRRNKPEAKKDKYPFKSYYAKPDLAEETDIPVIRKSDSSSSIDKIEKELSYFVMEKKRGVFSIFRRSKSTTSTSKLKPSDESDKKFSTLSPQSTKKITKEDEVRYAKNHIQKFNKIKDRFENEPVENNNDIKRDSKTLILQDIRDNLERQVETQKEIKHSSRRPQNKQTFDTIDVVTIRKHEKPTPNPKPVYIENNTKVVSSPKLKIPSNRVIEQLRPRTPTKNTNRIIFNEDQQIQKKPLAKTRSLNHNHPEGLVFNYDQNAIAKLQHQNDMSPIPYTPSPPANKNLMKKSVEAYYWRELRKMQEEELSRELEYNQRIHGYLNSQLKSNSMSPISQRNTRQYYPDEVYSPIYEDVPIVRRSSLMENPTQMQYNRPASSSTINSRYMLVPIKQNEVYYSDDEYARPYVQQRPRIRRPTPQNNQTYYHPQNSIRRSYTPSISGASASASTIYDYPGNVHQQIRLSYAQPQHKNTIQHTQNGVYGTVQNNPQFVRNTRFTSSMGNMQNYPRGSQNHAIYGRLV
ncbi:unnamed protein product [Brassicogethes aeneus]|uniref:Uncharacterized protein n=1 Tax=Brassicogethes aeneus TaxID=1431903 RepID=A0A9P0B8F5_BRAAE|nr:unnamed protein product [Brassicogethes aeneus]